MKNVRTLLAIAFAFVLGVFAARLPQVARAAPAPVEATSIDLSALTPADMPPPSTVLPDLHTKLLAKIDATAFYYQIGTAPKHTHAATSEVQLFLEGSGTEWLGDKQVAIKPGTLVIIPPNTPHSGFTGGPFHFYTVKTPPQDPADYHPLP